MKLVENHFDKFVLWACIGSIIVSLAAIAFALQDIAAAIEALKEIPE